MEAGSGKWEVGKEGRDTGIREKGGRKRVQEGTRCSDDVRKEARDGGGKCEVRTRR